MAITLTQSSAACSRTVTEFPTDYWNDSCAQARS